MNFVYDGTQYRFAGWGVDSNSDTKVTQSRDTSSSTYPVLLKYNTTTGDGTSTVKFNESINVTPSTGTLSATKFVGELNGKATTAGTADKVANSLTIKGNNTTAGTYNGSAATSVNIVGAGSTTVSGANGTITITGATIPTKLPNEHSLTIGSVEYDGSAEATIESLKNPYSLIIQGNGTTLTNGTYDGSAAKTVNITPASIGALAANGTAVKATADASGKNIASTYETKANVTTKISEALNTAKDYTDTSISSLVNGAPEHLNTLKELADALGADENMSTTIVGMIGGKADKVHTHTDEDIIRSNWPSTHTITGNTLAEMLEDIEGHIDDTVGHIQNNTIHITSAERTQWNKAEVNQNAFSNIAVSGQTTVAADSKTDTVTFAGSNITITTDATNDKITFTVADGTTDAKGVVKLEDSVSSTSTSTAATPNSVRTAYVLANGKAPKAHAVNASTYGLGTSGVYGHVKLSDSTASTSAETAGIAATPKAVKTAYDLANSANTKAGTNATDIVQLKEDVKGIAIKAPISHASSATTYGTGTSSNYGHVKLSDSTSSTSAASAGIAATPKAVNTAYNLANTAKGVADGAASKASSNETKIGEINTSINNLSSGKAPTNHASSETTYGTGSGDNYGHVKLSASVTDTSGITSGTAATPSAVKSAYDLANSANTKAGTNASNITQLKEDVKGIATKAPISHAVNANTYGLGTSSVYGHVKLSDSTSTASSVNAGVAATPTAVKTAYDLANTANATAGEAKTKATTNATAIEELNSSVNSHTHTVTGTVSKPSFTGSAATSRGPSNTTTVNSVTGVGTTPTLTSTVTNRCLKFTFSAGTTPSITSVTVPTSNHTHSVTATGSVSQPTFTSGTAASISSASV